MAVDMVICMAVSLALALGGLAMTVASTSDRWATVGLAMAYLGGAVYIGALVFQDQSNAHITSSTYGVTVPDGHHIHQVIPQVTQHEGCTWVNDSRESVLICPGGG